MKVMYHSLTGNIDRFLSKTTCDKELIQPNLIIPRNFLLITYTTGNGDIPKIVEDFMSSNHHNCIGLIGSGNKNWGDNYCNAVKKLNILYGIPILMRFEMSGNKSDITKFNKIIQDYNGR